MPIRAIVMLAAVVFCSSLAAGSAEAATRHCQSYYEADIKTIDGAASSRILRFGYFETRGSCGSNVPNRCRERAVETAGRCVQAHWEDRNRRNRQPEECRGSGIIGYTVWDIKDELELTVCCSPGGASINARTVVTEVFAATRGAGNCSTGTGAPSVHQRLSSGYVAHCDTQRMRRLCAYRRQSALIQPPYEPFVDRPGSDLRFLPGRTAGECQQACQADSACKAWTQVAGAKQCFLKDAVPPARFNGCCTSGVK
ncbi:MAG: PAN domain-containing protein [Pseudomonadota bacterium]